MHGFGKHQEGPTRGAEGINRRKGPIRIQGLGPHHLAWLSAHPTRNPVWLLMMLADGFEVHHLEGKHNNNDPNNLILVEHVDHRRLHGKKGQAFSNELNEERRQKIKHDLAMGEIAYEARITASCWQDVQDSMPAGFKGDIPMVARLYAAATERPWPFSKGRQKSFRKQRYP